MFLTNYICFYLTYFFQRLNYILIFCKPSFSQSEIYSNHIYTTNTHVYFDFGFLSDMHTSFVNWFWFQIHCSNTSTYVSYVELSKQYCTATV